MLEPSLFTVSGKVDGADATVAVAGEFDLDGSPTFLATVEQALRGRIDVVTIDASQLSFADSSAIVALLQAREAAEARNVKFRIAPISPALHRIFVLAGVEEVFEVFDTFET